MLDLRNNPLNKKPMTMNVKQNNIAISKQGTLKLKSDELRF